MALGAKMDGNDFRVWVVTSDAEHQCGLHWEAVLTAAKFKLDNLTAIVDRNFIQIDGSTEDVMPLEPFADKYRAFNWEVLECDGNDIDDFIATAKRATQCVGKPQVIVANTVPGQGRLVHGRRLHVARQAAERGAGRAGAERTEAARKEIVANG